MTNHVCPQCGFEFMDGEMIAVVTFICPDHGEENEMMHPGTCVVDYMADVPRIETRRKMIVARRVN